MVFSDALLYKFLDPSTVAAPTSLVFSDVASYNSFDFSAALIKTEIIDISRFASFNRLCAYAGLAPRVSASANKIFHGPLNKNRRKNLQWIFLENVYHFIKAIPEMQEKYEILKQRKGHNTAKVALARAMLKIIYHILKERRPFYFSSSNCQIQSVAASALSGV